MNKVWIFLSLAVVVLPVAWIDLRYRRIPNECCLAGLVLGVACHALQGGLSGAGSSLLALLIVFSASFPFWLMGWFGAGDVKLAAVVGGIVGMNLLLPVLAGIAIAGGAVALVYLLVLKIRDEPLYVIMACRFYARKTAGAELVNEPYQVPVTRNGIPYAIPIAIGSLSAIVYLS